MDFDNENRIVSPDLNEVDNDIETSLRPKTFNEYIGQEKAKENLKIYIDAAKARGDVLDTCCSMALPDSERLLFRA